MASPSHVYQQWACRLEAESFLQGDRERASSIPVSPLMDRHTGRGMTLAQVSSACMHQDNELESQPISTCPRKFILVSGEHCHPQLQLVGINSSLSLDLHQQPFFFHSGLHECSAGCSPADAEWHVCGFSPAEGLVGSSAYRFCLRSFSMISGNKAVICPTRPNSDLRLLFAGWVHGSHRTSTLFWLL